MNNKDRSLGIDVRLVPTIMVVYGFKLSPKDKISLRNFKRKRDRKGIR